MARRKSNAQVGPSGVWAYDTRTALNLSVEGVVAMLPTSYHPATLRKVEGGSAVPGTRMWRELGNLYSKLADEQKVPIDPQPRLGPEPVENPPADPLVAAIAAQTAAISELVAELRRVAEGQVGMGIALGQLATLALGLRGLPGLPSELPLPPAPGGPGSGVTRR